ncbi:beta-galactosidase [Microbacterium sp. 22215]|uniref:beta-galactosidase n=1 Tax=Microbacterium sp. 22215 TaxID=3453893 RepID=UPI003F87C311
MTDRHADGRTSLTSRFITRGGRPYFPVSGEFHFTRIPRTQWQRRLRAMRNGGVNTVAAYIFWNHHQPLAHESPAFDDNRDVAAFVDLCAELGLDVVLRIGPWCHGEVRNGGFPDWVQSADVDHRTDDPRYLALVEPWYRALSHQLTGRFGPDSNIIGIQIENEIYDQSDHVATLKGLAKDVGMDAPLWMATAWGSAQLPADEVLPMYGGYADGFWVDAGAPWDDSFREHFYFSHVWDDPGIGADVRSLGGTPPAPDRQSPSDTFPPVTCELGGGMATAYHRRPVLTAEDVAAVANAKIGNGSAWQGYYMFAGGLNPSPDLQESHATGYPNDMPQIDYDFHAPIGSAGQITRTHALLRQQHAFLAAVGEELVLMTSTLPDAMPENVHDLTTMRWAMRSDGHRGYVFVNRQQPHVPLAPSGPVQFQLDLASTQMTFPDQPIRIPVGTVARFPFRQPVGEAEIDWATANLLTVLRRPHGGTVAVLFGVKGLSPRISVNGKAFDADADSIGVHAFGDDAIVMLPAEDAESAWVVDGKLYLSADELDPTDGEVRTWVRSGAGVRAFDTKELAFFDLQATESAAPAVSLELSVVRLGVAPAPSYGEFEGRASAPSIARVLQDGMLTEAVVPSSMHDRDVELALEWVGDVAVLTADGSVISDRFWDGTEWHVRIPAGVKTIGIHVLPLHEDASVWLHPDARVRLENCHTQGVKRIVAHPVQTLTHLPIAAGGTGALAGTA